MINLQPIFYELNWSFSKCPSLNESQPRLDSIEHDDNRDLDPDLRLADDASELPTLHGPTMR